jgi:hypothetical protein
MNTLNRVKAIAEPTPAARWPDSLFAHSIGKSAMATPERSAVDQKTPATPINRCRDPIAVDSANCVPLKVTAEQPCCA